ncbi:MAG: AraC family transcriptional regulator [Marinobacter sp.]|nr:AraC family transcriptional regulator [Marinobacter sp.]
MSKPKQAIRQQATLPTLSGSLAGVLLDFLNAEGIPAHTCRARLAHWKPDGRIAAMEWVICLHLIQQEAPRPALGLAIARHFQLEHAGLLAYSALSCDYIGELFNQFDRLHRLMWQGFDVTVSQSDDCITLAWSTRTVTDERTEDPVRLAYETGIAGIVQIFRILCGDTHSPCAVTLIGRQPHDLSAYEAFFRCPVTFNRDQASLTFPIATRNLPISAKRTILKQLVERQAEAQLLAIDATDTFMAAFRSALGRAISGGRPAIEQVAKQLAISRITLQRRLAARNTGFQEALDKTRFEMARMYMEDPQLSLADIALLLAFSEQSAFCRAFRRWSGETPQHYRKARIQQTVTLAANSFHSR